MPRGLERIKSDVELPHARQIEQTLANSQRDQQELARFYLDHARRLVAQESDREAMAELNRVLFLSPYDAEAHLLVGRVHLRAGHVREAIDALNISIWSADTADAHALLGGGLPRVEGYRLGTSGGRTSARHRPEERGGEPPHEPSAALTAIRPRAKIDALWH